MQTGATLGDRIAMAFSESFYALGQPLFIYTNSDLLSGHTLLVVSPWLLFCIEALLVSVLLIADRSPEVVRLRDLRTMSSQKAPTSVSSAT